MVIDLFTTPLPPTAVDLESAGALAYVVAPRRVQDQAAADEMRAVCVYADLHRVEAGAALATGALDEEIREAVIRGAGGSIAFVAGEHGTEGELRLAGEGCFMVAEFAVAELAAALGLSEPAARRYVGQSVELRDRLPRLWTRVMAGELAAWKARQMAEQTIPLNVEAAEYVDAHLAPFAHKLSLTRIRQAVEAAVLWHDPHLAAERSEQAAENRGVWSEDRVDGTSCVTAVVDTPDALALDAALDAVARALGELGDPNEHRVRRAKAVGVLADPQYALQLTTGSAAQDQAESFATPRAGRGAPVVHVHLHTDATEGLHGVYEAPDRLRVEHRDTCCVFPWCGDREVRPRPHRGVRVRGPGASRRRAPPPGQTTSENLARLCRFHHRLKTFTDWTYRREPDGSLTWTSPLGLVYRVGRTGTLPVRT